MSNKQSSFVDFMRGARPISPAAVTSKEEPGLGLGAAVKAFVEGAPIVWDSAANTASDVIFGFDPNDKEREAGRAEDARRAEAYVRKYKGKGSAAEAVAGAAESSGTSIVGIPAGLVAAAPALAAGPAAAAGAFGVASGATASRADYVAQQRALYEEAVRRNGGQPLTDERWQSVLAEFGPELAEHAVIEGAGEAVGDALTFGIFKPAGVIGGKVLEKVGEGVTKKLIRGAGKVGADVGGELITETGQSYLQGAPESQMYGTERPTLGETFSEVAGPTIAQSLIFGAGAKASSVVANRLRRKSGAGLPDAGEGTTPANSKDNPFAEAGDLGDGYQYQNPFEDGTVVEGELVEEPSAGEPLGLPYIPGGIQSGATRQFGVYGWQEGDANVKVIGRSGNDVIIDIEQGGNHTYESVPQNILYNRIQRARVDSSRAGAAREEAERFAHFQQSTPMPKGSSEINLLEMGTQAPATAPVSGAPVTPRPSLGTNISGQMPVRGMVNTPSGFGLGSMMAGRPVMQPEVVAPVAAPANPQSGFGLAAAQPVQPEKVAESVTKKPEKEAKNVTEAPKKTSEIPFFTSEETASLHYLGKPGESFMSKDASREKAFDEGLSKYREKAIANNDMDAVDRADELDEQRDRIDFASDEAMREIEGYLSSGEQSGDNEFYSSQEIQNFKDIVASEPRIAELEKRMEQAGSRAVHENHYDGWANDYEVEAVISGIDAVGGSDVSERLIKAYERGAEKARKDIETTASAPKEQIGHTSKPAEPKGESKFLHYKGATVSTGVPPTLDARREEQFDSLLRALRKSGDEKDALTAGQFEWQRDKVGFAYDELMQELYEAVNPERALFERFLDRVREVKNEDEGTKLLMEYRQTPGWTPENAEALSDAIIKRIEAREWALSFAGEPAEEESSDVKKPEKKTEKKKPEKKATDEDFDHLFGTEFGTVDAPKVDKIADYFKTQFLSGRAFKTIGEARQEVAHRMGRPKMKDLVRAFKTIDEAIELGVVRAAREIVRSGKSQLEVFRDLVDLYKRQPNLGVRTSTSVAEQAYSTPVPLAYLADVLAGVDGKTSVYEPTAGNGALLLTASPKNAVVNELNHDRAERLRSLGFTVTEEDAVNRRLDKPVEAVVANPPFGTVLMEGGKQKRRFDIMGFETTEIDQAISLAALDMLEEGGRAVLIIGGKKGGQDARSKKYNTANQRAFWDTLFRNFNVVDHFTVDGKLYSRQGAEWPIDFIVIDGHTPTENPVFPAANVPPVFDSFEALEEKLNEVLQHESKRPERDRVVDRTGDTQSGLSDGLDSRVGSEVPDGRGIGDQTRNDAGVDKRPVEQERGAGSGSDEGEPGGRNKRTVRDTGRAGRDGVAAESSQPDDQRGQLASGDGAGRGRAGLRAGEELHGTDRGAGAVRSGLDVERPSLPETSKAKKAAPKPKETETQASYKTSSDGFQLGTLVPRNMDAPVQDALSRVKSKHDSVDVFVAEELGYGSVDEMHEAFAAEQVDALALALDNMKRGKGFILGDQTGIGKGRVCAGIIRWAKKNGKTPVFVTMLPDLYADMMRDLNDIGVKDFHPLITNADMTGKKALVAPDGSKLAAPTDTKYKKAVAYIKENKALPEEYDAIFTSYSQMQSKKGTVNPRQGMLIDLRDNVVLVLDEAHNAGGSTSSIGEFFRSYTSGLANGVLYSSATYAKRPDVMSLYNTTDLSLLGNQDEIEAVMRSGGLSMQQVVSAMLTTSGQYVRREKSYEGADMTTTEVPVSAKLADGIADCMAAVMKFSVAMKPAVQEMDKVLKAQGKTATGNRGTGGAGASSTSFGAVMHNLVAQSTLAIKADATIQAAKAAVERGEKPIITLSNTMGSFIEEYVKTHGLKAGDRVDLTFADLFKNYLEKTREVVVRKPNAKKGEAERIRISDKELTSAARKAYKDALSLIESIDFSGIPISPIDYIIEGLKREGVVASEITGRTAAIDYSGDFPVYRVREASVAEKQRASSGFNSGTLSVLIINRSGSTGISLHASEKFKDQKRRTMFILQPDLNIDVFMQTLGRVFRTGQVVPPKYEFILSDMPSERRPAAVLGKKMASLNANTTASAKGTQSFDNIPDFLNVYGDQAAYEILTEDRALDERLGDILGDSDEYDGLIAKLTGRIPLLRMAEQADVYDRIQSVYQGIVDMATATGTNVLDVKAKPLDAKILRRAQFTSSTAKASPFGEASELCECDVKVLGKPFTAAEVKKHIEEGKAAAVPVEQLAERKAAYEKERLKKLENDEAKDRESEKLDEQFVRVTDAMNGYPVGTRVRLNSTTGSFVGFVVNYVFDAKKKGSNPVAPSSWRVLVDIADAKRRIAIPLSKLVLGDGNIDEGRVLMNYTYDGVSEADFFKRFDEGQSESREKRYIVMGNIPAGFKFAEKGEIITFDMHDGRRVMGLMLPKDVDGEQLLSDKPVEFSTPAQVEEFLLGSSDVRQVKSSDGKLSIDNTARGGFFNVRVPASKKDGGTYFLDKKLTDAMDSIFIKSGEDMKALISKYGLKRTLNYLAERGVKLQATANKDAARKITGATDSMEATASLRPSFAENGGPNRTSAIHRKAIRDAVQGMDTLSGQKTVLVDSFEQLPDDLREMFAGHENDLEGVYHNGVVYMVADNIRSASRAGNVWMHEHVGHGGFESLMGERAKTQLLNRLFAMLGGRGNVALREIAEQYGADTTTSAGRGLVMREYLARLSEKESLTEKERGLWQRAWKHIADTLKKLWYKATGNSVKLGEMEVRDLVSAMLHSVRGSVDAGTIGSDGGTYPSVRKAPAPKKTQKAYKLFRVDERYPGKLFPLFVLANEPAEMGVWLDAEIGEMNDKGKVKSKLGGLAFRPGWHAGDLPLATHIGEADPEAVKKDPKLKSKPQFRAPNQVWAEVEVADDVDWQTEANKRAERNKKGEIIHRTAHITDQLPVDGFYRYKTNANMTGEWIISGSMKINRVLTDAEVSELNSAAGLADLPRREPFDAKKYGFDPDGGPDGPKGGTYASFIRDAADSAFEKTAKMMGKPDTFASDARKAYGKLSEQAKQDISLWNRFVSQPYAIAKKFPLLRTLMDIQSQREDKRREAYIKSMEGVDTFEKMKKSNPTAYKYARDLIVALDSEEGDKLKKNLKSEMFLFDEDGKRTGFNPEYYREMRDLLMGKRNKQTHTDADAYSKAVDAYMGVRQSLDRDLDSILQRTEELGFQSEQEWKAEFNKRKAELEADDNLTKEQREAELEAMRNARDRWLEKLDTMRKSMGRRPFYFPRMRFGSYYALFKNAEGQTVYRVHYDASTQALASIEAAKIKAAMEADLEKMGVDLDEVTFENGKLTGIPQEVFADALSTVNTEAIIAEAVKRMEKRGLNGSEAMKLRLDLVEQIAEVMKSSGFGQHMMRRADSKIAGYETEDIFKSLSSYKAGLHGWLTKMEASYQFASELSNFAAQDGVKKSPELYKYSQNYVRDMLRNADAVDRANSRLRTFLFLWFLGGNLKSAIVNATQNFTLGVPVLGAEIGFGKAWRKFGPGALDAVADWASKREAGQVSKVLTMEEAAFLDDFQKHGEALARKTMELTGLQDRGWSKSWASKIAEWAGKPIEYAEKFNRTSLALMAYRAAKAGDVTNKKTAAEYGEEVGKPWSEASARRFAREVVNEAHFVYGKANQPAPVRGFARGLGFGYTFRTYAQSLASWYTRMLMGEKGAAGRIAAVHAVLNNVMLGGMVAIPLYGTFRTVLSKFFGGEPPEEVAGYDQIDILMYGLPSLAGAYVGGSMELDVPVVKDVQGDESWIEQLQDTLWASVTGSLGGAADRLGRATYYASTGQTARTIEELSPTAVSNLFKAHRLSTEGARTKSGKPIPAAGDKSGAPAKLSGLEVILQAVGFQPVSRAKDWDVYQRTQEKKAHKSSFQSDLVTEYVMAKTTKERTALENKRLRWNKEHPDQQIQPLWKLAKQRTKPVK